MALTAAQLLADQAYLFGDFPSETLSIGGNNYNVFVPRAEESEDWGMGGNYPTPHLMLIFNRNQTLDFIGDNILGTQVTFRARTWRIMGIRHDAAHSPLTITLESIGGKPV